MPLTAHCLDVAVVFRTLCELTGFGRALQCAAERPLSASHLDRLAVLAALHDIGKANLGFQRKVFSDQAPQAGHIRELAPLLDPEILDEELHTAFLRALPPGMEQWFGDEQVAYSYFLATFSHHGRPLQFQGQQSGTYWQARQQWWRRDGRWDPIAAVAEVARWAQAAFPGAFEPGAGHLPSDPRLHHRFAGLLMLADWLGSHPHWFPVERVDIATRLRHAREVAPKLLLAVGLDVNSLRPLLLSAEEGFQQRFGFPPRPLQAALDGIDTDCDLAHLIIAESDTGSGKTEAALNWWFKLFRAGKVDGLYFALPTRVAAREMYRRVRCTVERWFPDPARRPVTLLAVPGYPQVDGVPLEKALPEERSANLWQDDEALQRRHRLWSAERPKRFLAATVAVGTVDQALLSAVQTAHAHLRSVCLDRSLLVVDEVHASDVYMSRLLESLLDHHLGVGGYAMLLSATLGARARHRLVAHSADDGRPLPDAHSAEGAPYPSFTLADGTPRPVALGPTHSRPVRFELLPVAFQPEAIVNRLVQALSAGARVLVVMNTVRRANSLLRALEAHPSVDPAWLFACEGVVCPHHGRFAPEDRVLLDARVTERLGPGSPSGPVLLVGTQTLEQSLDIDADVLFSDLAPADVILQRVGRLQRHNRERPSGYASPPRCFLLTTEGDLATALDERGQVASAYRRLGYGSVYEDLRTLELTRRILTAQPEVVIPRDNRRLVEGVTHPEHLGSLDEERWVRHGENVDGGDLAQAIAAGHAAAIFHRYFGEFAFNEAGGKVAVRLGADSLQLPLDRPLMSPFGQEIRELVIPGHMAPGQPAGEIICEETSDGTTTLRCAERRYTYGRYGLEEVKQRA